MSRAREIMEGTDMVSLGADDPAPSVPPAAPLAFDPLDAALRSAPAGYSTGQTSTAHDAGDPAVAALAEQICAAMARQTEEYAALVVSQLTEATKPVFAEYFAAQRKALLFEIEARRDDYVREIPQIVAEAVRTACAREIPQAAYKAFRAAMRDEAAGMRRRRMPGALASLGLIAVGAIGVVILPPLAHAAAAWVQQILRW